MMGSLPNEVVRVDSLPVEMIDWNAAVSFCEELNRKENLPSGWSFHLPTEEQWKYACRAGTSSSYSFGNQIELKDAKWSDGGSTNRTVEVGQFEPNPWGFHDMHGNVWEWCLDWYGDYAASDITDPTGPLIGQKRIRRGGSWLNTAILLRSG